MTDSTMPARLTEKPLSGGSLCEDGMISGDEESRKTESGSDEIEFDNPVADSAASRSERQNATPSPRMKPKNALGQESISGGMNKPNDVRRRKRNRPSSIAPTSSYAFRNRSSKQTKLIYDLKYHPMDDAIRPSQAAKRRSVHSEGMRCSDDTSETTSIHSDTIAGSSDITDESELEEELQKALRDDKSKQKHRHPSEPIRRSARKTSDKKLLYNMKVHPQDYVLELLSDKDNDDESPLKRKKLKSTSLERASSTSSEDRASETTIIQSRQAIPAIRRTGSSSTVSDQDHDSTSTEHSKEAMESAEVRNAVQESLDKIFPSPSSLVTPPPYEFRRIDAWKMPLGERDSWPRSSGDPFQIYVESLEDQLAKEAMAASPLNYEHDDKENNVDHQDSHTEADTRESMSIIPASMYTPSSDDERTSREMAQVYRLLYDDHGRLAHPYGIGGSDGAMDTCTLQGESSPLLKFMRILASSEGLPQDVTPEKHA